MALNVSPRPQLAALLLGMVLMAGLVNVAQFAAIEERAQKRYQAIARYDKPDLRRIGSSASGAFKNSYAAALAMAELAPGSTLLLPAKGPYPDVEFVSKMLTFGRLKAIRRVDYNPTKLAPGLTLTKHVLAKQSGKNKKSRRDLMLGKSSDKKHAKRPKRPKTDSREFILLKRGATDVVVDTGLIADEVKELHL